MTLVFCFGQWDVLWWSGLCVVMVCVCSVCFLFLSVFSLYWAFFYFGFSFNFHCTFFFFFSYFILFHQSTLLFIFHLFFLIFFFSNFFVNFFFSSCFAFVVFVFLLPYFASIYLFHILSSSSSCFYHSFHSLFFHFLLLHNTHTAPSHLSFPSLLKFPHPPAPSLRPLLDLSVTAIPHHLSQALSSSISPSCHLLPSFLGGPSLFSSLAAVHLLFLLYVYMRPFWRGGASFV